MKYLLTLLTIVAISSFAVAQDQSNYDLAKDYAKKGLFKKAIEIVDLAIEKEAPRSAHYLSKARYFAMIDQPENAEQTLNIGIKLFPDSIGLYLMRGGYFSAVQHEEAAIVDFESALALTDDKDYQVNILTTIGGLYAQVRKFDKAHEELKKALAIDETNLNVLNNLATLSDEIGRPDDTFKYLEKIIDINPEYLPAIVNLGFKYQLEGEHEKALTYFDRAIDMDPNEPLAYSNRSYSRLVTNDLSGAMKDVDLSISLFPRNSWAYKIRALIHVENGEMHKACEDLQIAKELGFEKRYGSEVNELMDKYCGEKS